MPMGYIYMNSILCDITILTQSNAHGLQLRQHHLIRHYHTTQSNVQGLQLHQNYLM